MKDAIVFGVLCITSAALASDFINTTKSSNFLYEDAYLSSGYRKFAVPVAPHGTFTIATNTIFKVDLGVAAEAYEKAKAFVTPLNTTEKIAIVMASSFTGTNSSWTKYSNTDGVCGLNFYYYVSAFPMTNALTMTWNRELISEQFKAIGEEYFATGNDVVDGALLSPLGRVPQGRDPTRTKIERTQLMLIGGRQNEAFSPDPYLAGVAAAVGVTGQQSAGVIAGVRHFLLYEQEKDRSRGRGSESSDSVYSSNVDDKTLHEVYMWPWGDTIKAGAQAVMCAMPRVNGTHSCSNEELLTGKLKL